jgi:hypothetical protein
MEHICAHGNLILVKFTLYYKGPGRAGEICSRGPTMVVNTFIHEFTLFSYLFLQMLHAHGDSELSNTLRAEYFQGIKRVWARCMM